MAKGAKKVNYSDKLLNPSKYVGKHPIILRSSWEVTFAKACDTNPMVLEWASEPMEIPYKDPITGSQKVYIPDFLLSIRKPDGSIYKLLVEIKPEKEALIESVRSAVDAASYMRNQAKWIAASWWCQRRGVSFRILTETSLFGKLKAPDKVKKAAAASAEKARKNLASRRKKFSR